MKKIFLATVAVMLVVCVMSQTPVGNWKAFDFYTQTVGGKKVDLLKDLWKDPACYKEVVYQLTADGKMSASAGKCKDAVGKINAFVGWKMDGKSKIVLFPDDKDMDPQVYQLEFIGNRMRWTMNFPGPGNRSADEVKLLVFEYVKRES